MKKTVKFSHIILTVGICALVLLLVIPNRVRAATWQSGMPVRCDVYINNDLTSQNVPMTCTTPDGNEYINVPEGLYLYVTDIIVRNRLTTQPTVGASVRIWEEYAGSGTGCSEDSVIGSFVTDQYISLVDTSVSVMEHIAYNTPYLVLTPNDCLAVYTSTAGGVIVELSGYQWTSLGIPVMSAFLPTIQR